MLSHLKIFYHLFKLVLLRCINFEKQTSYSFPQILGLTIHTYSRVLHRFESWCSITTYIYVEFTGGHVFWFTTARCPGCCAVVQGQQARCRRGGVKPAAAPLPTNLGGVRHPSSGHEGWTKKRLDLMTSNNVCYFNNCLLWKEIRLKRKKAYVNIYILPILGEKLCLVLNNLQIECLRSFV